MEEEKIKFETAKIAKEKGFIEYCDNWWDNELEYHLGDSTFSDCYPEIEISEITGKIVVLPEKIVLRPTQSLLQKWLREDHNIETLVRPFINRKTHEKHYRAFVIWFDGKIYHDDKYFTHDTWEGTLEIVLQEALKLIPNK